MNLISQVLDLVSKAAVSAVGIVAMKTESTSERTKIPTNGHYNFGLTSKGGAGTSATVKLKGTNNPDPADTTGEDLITNTHAGGDQQDGSVANKGYKYVFVQVTAVSGITFDAGDIRLYGTGFAGGA